jgi:hypothetical protein
VGYGHEDASPPQEASHGAAPAAAPEAEPLLNALVSELQQNRADYEAAIAHATPLLHKSLLSPDGASVTADLRRFSFKKAFDNAGHYALPVRVLRARPSHVTGIGFGPTAERGRVVDYFIAKREGVAGMPAPVSVFFPEGGGPAKIAYVGSL